MRLSSMFLLSLTTTTTNVAAFSPRLLSRTMRVIGGSTAALTTTPGAFVSATTSSSSSFFHTSRRSMTSLKASSDGGFKTWTFDKHCDTMDWSPLHAADVVVSSEEDKDADLVVLGVYAPVSDDEEEEEEKEETEEDEDVTVVFEGTVAALDAELGGALTDVAKENAKSFKNGAVAGVTTPTIRAVVKGEDGVNKSKRYILIGLGKAGKDMDESSLTKIGATIASQCDSEKGVTSCSVLLPSSPTPPLAFLSRGFYTSLYSDNRFRSGAKVKKTAKTLSKVTITIPDSDDTASASLASGRDLASGVYLGKDIVNAPHNILNSVSLATTAKRIAEESGGVLKCTILGKKECEARGMGAYLGVARGSETEPQFIHLTYKPKSGTINKKVGIIGKGLLFDTGGYNIKTAMMELMKFDCGGAAAVLGAARATAALQPDGVEAHFIVAACENMINAKAVVPSDILTASNGKTIEVLNTDAEGRLTLADALVYADKELSCEKIIELSTLTGACMISLGKEYAGVWTDDDKLAEELKDVSKVTGDKSWRMPLAKEYNEQLESMIADIKNIGTRYGGAITAALFLQNFVSKKIPFAHIDIAGPVWSDKNGATGYGVGLVTEWVRRQGLVVEDKTEE